MKLHILGSGGFIPTEHRQTACYFLPETGVMLDAGSGLYRCVPLLQTTELHIFLSHSHGDHTSGLMWLFACLLMDESNRRPEGLTHDTLNEIHTRANARAVDIHVYATPRVLDTVTPLYRFPVDWVALDGETSLPCGGHLRAFPLDPDREETGFRLNWPGHSMAYVTDTVASAHCVYREEIRGVDLLVHDCNGPDRVGTLMDRVGHSHTTPVVRLAAEAGVRQLLLIHENPFASMRLEEDLAAARAIFPDTCIAEDGGVVEF